MIKMMMMTRKLCIISFLLFLPFAAFTQDKDFGIWYGISVKHDFLKNLDLNFSAVIRTFNNASKIDQEFLECGLGYKFSRYLSAMASYRLTNSIEDNFRYYFQHKWLLDLKGNLPVSDFHFTCRLRFQTRIKTYIEDEEDNFPDYTGRVKLKVIYKAPSFPVNPYVYVESFFPMFSDKTRIIENNRFAAGLEYSISKRYSIDAEYLFQRDYLPDLSDENIISINLNIKF
jgi:hypothetical protein